MIDTKALRSRILDLAIQGKLTEQLPSESIDTTDISLLSEFPYTIPKNWKWTTIQSIVSKDVGGGTPSKSMPEYWKNGDIPWMSVKDFSSAKNGILDDTIDHITQAGLDNSSSNLVDEEAIIICMRMALGKIVKINKPMAINQDLRAIWLKSFIDNNYFVFFYSTLKVEGHGMTVAGISKAQLMSYPFPLPPLAEQKRIVERVEEIFRLLDTIDKAQEKYSADSQILKAKLITAGIQGKLTKQLESDGTAHELYQQIQEEKQKLIKEGKLKKEKPLPPISPDEIPFEIPQNWMWVRLSEIVSFIGGYAYKSSDFIEKSDNQVLRLGNVKNDELRLSMKPVYINDELANDTIAFKCRINDILITMTGTRFKRDYFFSVRILSDTPSLYINQRVGCLRAFESSMAPWLTWTLKSNPILSDVFQYETGSANQGNLGSENILKVKVPLPPLAEQKRIADVLERVLGGVE